MARARIIGKWTRQAMESHLGVPYPKAREQVLAGFVKLEDAVNDAWRAWEDVREAGGAAADRAYRTFVRANQRSADYMRAHGDELEVGADEDFGRRFGSVGPKR